MPASLDDLIQFYQTLTPDSIGRFADFYSPQATFKDPFNDVKGIPAIEQIFRHMFQQVADPRFYVTETLTDGHSAVLVWNFTFRVRFWGAGRKEHLHGLTHLQFGADGKVLMHRDYWDTAEELYMKVPGLGCVLKGMRRALSAS